jgi:hypothetical protein
MYSIWTLSQKMKNNRKIKEFYNIYLLNNIYHYGHIKILCKKSCIHLNIFLITNRQNQNLRKHNEGTQRIDLLNYEHYSICAINLLLTMLLKI